VDTEIQQWNWSRRLILLYWLDCGFFSVVIQISSITILSEEAYQRIKNQTSPVIKSVASNFLSVFSVPPAGG
jgi:hypothetical protein